MPFGEELVTGMRMTMLLVLPSQFVQNVQLRCPLWINAGCQLQLNSNTKEMRLLSYCA